MDLKGWNAALFKRLQEDADPWRRVYVYVDREVLADVAGGADPDAATENFCEAFRAAAGRNPFERSLRQARAWRDSGWVGDPPLVAALAMTTLGVTEEPLGRTHGVYKQQNQLLGLPVEAIQPPGYAEHVPALWRLWNRWLEGAGRWLGRPSAHSDNHFVHQGWARSQGLIRFRDRLFMEEYFSTLRSRQLAGLSPEGRAREFLNWLGYRGERARSLREKLQDEGALEILAEVLEDEEQRWLQGNRRVGGRGRRTVRGLLFYDTWDHLLDLALNVDDQIAGTEVDLGDGPETVAADESVRILTTGATSERLLADVSYEWELRPGLALSTSPSPAYVFREDATLGGRIEVRGEATSSQYYVLVCDQHVEPVADALGVEASQVSLGPAAGWNWLMSSGMPEISGALRALGLGTLARPSGEGIRLEGGLRLAGKRYLSGGEPDLLFPAGNSVVLDEGTTFDERPVLLADEALSPGVHELRNVTNDASIRFETVPPTRPRAVGSSSAWSLDSRHELLKGTSTPSDVARISGALIEGTQGGPPLLVAEVRQGDTTLVLDERGGLYELSPITDRWMIRAGLDAWNVDVLRSMRSMDPRPAFFLTLSARDRVTAVAIPVAAELTPGTVEKTPRPELLSKLYDKWFWIGEEADRRRNELLSQSLRRGVTGSAPAGRGNTTRSATGIPERGDLIESAVDGNPYDTVLDWLSELEKPCVSATRFAETWAWICNHHGCPGLADEWRLVLERLRQLGHIERDFRRSSVHLAAPALVPLPSAAGLRFFTGARPCEVLHRLDDPDDSNEAVAVAAASYVIHRKTQIAPVPGGTPLGPTAVYVAATPGQMRVIARGVRELGVKLPDIEPSRTLLSALSSIADLHQHGNRLEFPPSRHVVQWRTGRDLGAGRGWEAGRGDRAAGLYRYRTTSNATVYAWRPAVGEKLIHLPDRQTGLWLEEHRMGSLDRVRFDTGKRLLFVAASTALPHLLRRALVLRTGLMPEQRTLPVQEGKPRREEYLVFENVDRATAERVTSLLGQRLQDVNAQETE